MNYSRIVFIVVIIAASGCIRFRQAPDIPDADSLIAYLNEQGIGTDHVGFVTREQFTEAGQAYRLIGFERIHVFVYESTGAAEADVLRLTSRQLRVNNPSYFHRDNMIVIYWGRDTDVKIALANVLGPRLV